MSEHADKALALVLAYRKHAAASREPLRECMDATDGTPEDGHWTIPPCYFLWREGNHPESPPSEPIAADVAEWCEPCQHNSAVWKRRKAARLERGKVLRQMHSLAKRVAKGPGQ